MLKSLTLALGATTANIAIHKVNVGQSGLTYTPDTITAAVGDTVEFKFVGGMHDAAVADYTNPCQPAASMNGSFASGVIQGSPNNNNVFKVTINSTEPIFVYCSVSMHCSNGMVAAVNPTADRTVAAFRAAAKGNAGKTPTGVFGGVFGAPSS